MTRHLDLSSGEVERRFLKTEVLEKKNEWQPLSFPLKEILACLFKIPA